MRVSSIGKGLRQIPTPRSRLCEHISTENDNNNTLPSCRQRMYVTCPHCQLSLCLYHINEHQLIIRNSFDSLVNRLNECRYELTTRLSIPPNDQTAVDDWLKEFQSVIIPYVQRTCCQNDVKQDDVDRIENFLEKMFTIIQLSSDDNKIDRKRSKTSEDTDDSTDQLPTSKRTRIDVQP
ncbi:unnamed protein product [Adineta ricciae]|uniref:Uncharacterized protein n=1 Tax=Adineta ricciae TaxID=249248 RepID=A0A815P5V9_ADIRI|nr:unnamed protein product [Adineta ricciae]